MKTPRFLLLPGTLLALALLWCAGPGTADEPKGKGDSLPPALSRPVPEGPEDLRAIEKQVQAVVAKVRPAVVGIRMGAGQGSGVIVSEDGYVLTAGHVSGKPGRDVTVVLPDGRKLKAKTLGRNRGIDSGLVKITEPGTWPHVDMGKSTDVHRGQWVVAIGHPGGFRPNRTPVVRVGRVLVATRYFLRSDCTLVGGDSGGPLFDMNGRVVGIHSRIGGAITENVHVPVDTYRQTWDRLVKSDSWGGLLGQQVVHSPGGKVVLEVAGSLTAKDPTDAHQHDCYRQVHRLKMRPGSVYTIDMLSPNGKRLDPYLRLEDGKGAQLAEDDDSGGNLNSRILFRPTREDDYQIVTTTCNPKEVGPYKLVVKQLDLRESAVVGKVDVLRTLGLPKPHTPDLVEKIAKAGLDLDARLTLFDAKGIPAAGKELAFHWAKGGKTVKTDANGVARLEMKKDTTRELFAEVPAGYRAAFELTDGDGNPFPLAPGKGFARERVKSAGGKVALQAEGRLTEGDPFDPARKEGKCRRHVYLFRMAPGSAYTLDLESEDVDAFLRLEDSSGRQLAEDDDSGGRLNSRIVFRPMKDDTYRIIVTTCDPGQTGAYRLTVRQAEERPAENKQEKK
jgi:serine protease Do